MNTAPCALVVDDAPATRHRVAVLLQLAGWRVYEAVDVQEAIRAAGQFDPDLVVAEMRIRGGGGLTVVRHLRNSGSRALFLMVTTRPTSRERREVAAWGATFLAKPVDPELLVAYLNGQQVQTAIRGSARIATAAAEADDEHLGRIRLLYLNTLPQRLVEISDSAHERDTVAVAAAAHRLASASRQVGHWELAAICGSIAADAQRGVVSQNQLRELALVASTTRVR